MNIFKNKKVIFVGPAPILIGSNYGSVIDSYDVVIRTNGSWPVREELKKDYGSRCDAIFINHVYSQSNSIIKLIQNPVKYIFYFLETPVDLSKDLTDSTFICMDQYQISSKISDYLGFEFEENDSPLGGMYLIHTVLEGQPSEFKICGITNYENSSSPYLEKYLPDDFDLTNINKGHNPGTQKKYLSKLNTNHSISFDEITKKYLNL